MAFVYILQSESTGRFYVGSSDDLERRLSEHLRMRVDVHPSLVNSSESRIVAQKAHW